RQLLAGQARIGVTRRLVGRALEVRVAETAVAAFGNEGAVADIDEIGDQRLLILGEDLSAGGHLQNAVFAVCASAIAARPACAVPRLEVLLIAVVDERIEIVDAHRPHVAATAAVATVGTAELDIFL